MSDLCKFLAKLDNLQQASATKKAPFKAGSSLYKPTMLLAVVDSIRNARSGYTENTKVTSYAILGDTLMQRRKLR